MVLQRTLVLLKPDAVRSGLIGEVIGRFERKGLDIVAMRMLKLDDRKAEKHYAQHVGKSFFPELKDFITSDRCVAMVVEGEEAILVVRNLIGHKVYAQAVPGTIRGDFARSTTESVIHASDSLEAAVREIQIFFHDDGIEIADLGLVTKS